MRLLLSALFFWATVTNVSASNLFELTAPDIDGSDLPLSEFKGKVVLVVNTASRCGFAPQYNAMEEIFQKYRNQGFVVLVFPSNEEIKEFCWGYRISFPLLASSSLAGSNKQPVYEFLSNSSAYPAMLGEVRWNF
jgi:glutathione peroxidase